jgi:hypothetical protein
VARGSGGETLTLLIVAWLVGAVVAFAVWFFAALRARARDFRPMWAPALLTAVAWPLVLAAGAGAWLAGLIANWVRSRSG